MSNLNFPCQVLYTVYGSEKNISVVKKFIFTMTNTRQTITIMGEGSGECLLFQHVDDQPCSHSVVTNRHMFITLIQVSELM